MTGLSKCVCVEHLNRCKTSFFYTVRTCRGAGANLPIQSNEAMAFLWMSGLINHLYLHCFLRLCGKGLSQEPQQHFRFYTVVAT